MKSDKISWRILRNKKNKEQWIKDSLLFIKTSTLAREMLNLRYSIVEIEELLQSLGMNIEDWQIDLILKRTKKDQTILASGIADLIDCTIEEAYEIIEDYNQY